jgi:hypothetical protein
MVLVRALMVVLRELWLRKSKSIASSPILVLSYKSHAIDEFLADLVAKEPSKLTSKRLIRIGGQCQDYRLSQFSESAASQRDPEVTHCQKVLKTLHDIRGSIENYFLGNAASFGAFRNEIWNNSDNNESSRRKAAYDATETLMDSIVRYHMLQTTLTSLAVDDSSTSKTTQHIAKALSFLETDKKSGKPSFQIQNKLDDQTAGRDFLQTLMERSKHDSSLDHWGEVLHLWITGSCPLPLCTFSDNEYGHSCPNLALSLENPPLCLEHHCRFLSKNNISCCLPIQDEDSGFCSHHTCKAEECLACICDCDQNQTYCSQHACQQCVAKNVVPAALAEDDPPKNMCSIHPMCLIPACLEFCEGSNDYCPKHLVTTCSATAKRGRPCRGKPINRNIPFCYDHIHLQKAKDVLQRRERSSYFESRIDEEDEKQVPVPSAKQSVSDKCQAKNKKGQDCKGVPLPGQKYCQNHHYKNKAPSFPLPARNQNAGDKTMFAENQDGTDETKQQHDGSVASDEFFDAVQDSAAKDGNDDKHAEILQEVDKLPKETSSNLQKEDGVDQEVKEADPDDKLVVESDEIEDEDDGDHIRHLREVFEIEEGTSFD